MPQLTFLPLKKTITVQPGTELLDAARQAGIRFDAPCGGKGTCGKCLMRIVEGKVESRSVLSPELSMQHFVLSCKAYVRDTDVIVEVPEQLGYLSGKFADDSEGASLVDKDLMPRKWQYNPLVYKNYLEVPQPKADDGLSDLDRLERAIQAEFEKKDVDCTLAVLQKLPDALRADNGNVTVMLVREPDKYHLVDIEAGDRSASFYGIAVDIGTTTVAVELIHIPDGKIVAVRTEYNDQVGCGLDVISRINYAKKPERLAELRSRVTGTINRLIGQLATEHKIDKKDICNAAIAGNTTMIHLFLGINPEYIRLDPYTPAVFQPPFLAAADAAIDINPHAWISIAPAVGSYVGGDITSGLLCTALSTDATEASLFIDIGTNGEMVVGNSDFLMTCACSAGPAFEGGGIEYGMRASEGAIEKVDIDKETGMARCQVIGGGKPKGICGSGMISLLANLFLTGWIDAGGKMNRVKKSPSIVVEGRNAYYLLASAAESGLGKPIIIRELDIDNIIRAKAAIYSACSLMLKNLDMNINDVKTIYIAGGFGKFLDIGQAITIGLLPDLPREKFRYIGNSSLTGAYMVLISQDFRLKQAELASKMTYLDIGSIPGYMDEYTGAMFLPHTDKRLFPSVEQK